MVGAARATGGRPGVPTLCFYACVTRGPERRKTPSCPPRAPPPGRGHSRQESPPPPRVSQVHAVELFLGTEKVGYRKAQRLKGAWHWGPSGSSVAGECGALESPERQGGLKAWKGLQVLFPIVLSNSGCSAFGESPSPQMVVKWGWKSGDLSSHSSGTGT